MVVVNSPLYIEFYKLSGLGKQVIQQLMSYPKDVRKLDTEYNWHVRRDYLVPLIQYATKLGYKDIDAVSYTHLTLPTNREV